MDIWLINWIVPAFFIGPTALRLLETMPFAPVPRAGPPPASPILAAHAIGACKQLSLNSSEIIKPHDLRRHGQEIGSTGHWTLVCAERLEGKVYL